MKLKYTDKVFIKIVALYLVAAIGVPLWFMYGGGTIGVAIFFFILGSLIARLGNAGYHRWLAHNQFEPSWLGKKIMFYFMVMTGFGPPGHYVVSHLQHHKHTDEEGDPHGPKQIGFWRMFFGRYNEVTPTVSYMRRYARNKEAQWVTKHYWKLWLANWIFLGLISKWLMVWLAFLFSWSWIWTNVLNWGGHGGLKGEPTNLNWFCNIIMGGEDYHKNHHENPSQLVMGKYDTTGRFLVPWLLQ